MRRLLLISCLLAGPAFAQEDDRDYLTAFLEDSLSDAGRQVTVTGFAGALSSRATIERLTIADDTGVWLTLNGVVLDWSRSSLLSGALEVTELSADEILVDRLPVTGEDDLPSPEAQGFSLPELPVTVDIRRIAADRIALAPAVLGEAVTGSLAASMSLADGEGHALLDLFRTDATEGRITLDATYANTTRQLALDLDASEAAGGIVVRLLGVPGAPSARFEVQGSGPLEDFRADIRLATDGAERLAGAVELQREADGYRLTSDISGNLAPVLAPEHVDFFGDEVALSLDARRSTSGEVRIDRLDLTARALTASVRARVAADGLPELIDVRGVLAAPDGSPVLLPFGDTPTQVDRADFTLRLDQGAGDSWTGSAILAGLDRTDLQVDRVSVEGSGRISRSAADRSLDGTFRLSAAGIAPADPALAQAIGPDLSGGFRLSFQDGTQGLQVLDITLAGQGYSAQGAFDIAGLDKDLLTSGRLSVTASDFSRLSGLLQRPVGGAGEVTLSGSASSLSGFFDAELTFSGTGLQVDIPELDRLMAAGTNLRASLRRDETGTTLRALALDAGPLALRASGTVSSKGSDLAGRIELGDLSALGPRYSGALRLDANLRGTPEDATIDLSGTARSLRMGNSGLDRLLAWESDLALRLRLTEGRLQVEDGQFRNPQLRVQASGEISGTTRRITLDARLANLALFAPGFDGPLTLEGTATQDALGYAVDLRGVGPGQVTATATGRIAGNFGSADLAIRGTGRAELANLFLSPRAVSGPLAFDLRLNGPLRPASLGGRVTLSDGRITDPGLGLSLDQVEAIGTLQGGSLRLAMTSALSTGGRLRIDGPVGLTAPYPADLAITLDALRLYDPELYEARLGGTLTLTGPLTAGPLLSGRLQLAETEFNVPASGFASGDALLDITHRNEPAPVRTTRKRALLLEDAGRSGAGSGQARPVRLDLTISAPNRVFVRGRGIDAELGGELRLAGTTADVSPSGGFRLIRGRLDILGRRLVLSQADLTLEGSLVPEIAISASTESDGIQTVVTIAGPADDPVVSFTSSPELPQEEVLARLLFGRDLANISAFQAAQLANAVATLAGRGGEGLIGALRRGTGLDDLDVTTSEDGSTSLRAGKYISDNAYTEIELDQEGKSRINLNLDLREGVTVKGRVGADGDTGIGIFIEKDY